jgi:hypothetical protein
MFVPPGAGAGGLAPPSPAGAGQGPPGGQKGRGSVVMQPMAGGIGLVDFDSDYESDEDQPPQQSVPGVSGTSKPDDRPMVGGFAAAAYEAAKAFHAQQKAKKEGAPAAAPAPKRSGSGRPQQG